MTCGYLEINICLKEATNRKNELKIRMKPNLTSISKGAYYGL